MATRGGSSGNQDAFAAGHMGAGGAGMPSGFDYEGEWKATKPTLANQPVIPPSTDSEGLELGNKEQREHQQRRWDAWNNARTASKPEVKAAGLPGVQVDPEVLKIANEAIAGAKTPKDTGMAEPVGQRRGGPVVQETMPGKKFGQHLFALHRQLSDVANALVSTKDPVLQAYGSAAQVHLHGYEHDVTGEHIPGAGDHIADGDADMKSNTYQYRARDKYKNAARAIANAHAYLSNPSVRELGTKLGINTELPSLDKMHEAAGTARVLLPANPFDKVNLGREMLDVNDPKVLKATKRVNKRGVADSDALKAVKKKLNTARSGTRRRYRGEAIAAQETARANDADQSLTANDGTQTVGSDRAADASRSVRRRATKTVAVNRFGTQANRNTPRIMGKPD